MYSWHEVLSSMQDRMVNPYTEDLADRIKAVRPQDLEALRRSLSNPSKRESGFVPDLGLDIVRRPGYRSDKVLYIQKIMATLSHMAPPQISHPSLLEREELDRLR